MVMINRALLSTYQGIPLRYANRHGLITGKTGSGKTVSLMRLIEQFAQAGIPCLVTDIKGDISALSRSNKTQFIDSHGRIGKPLTLSLSAMGVDITSRALDLTDTQAGVLEIAFHYATAARLPLHSIDNLRTILNHLKQGKADSLGTVSNQSIGVIQRALLRLESQGGNQFFNARTFDIESLLDPGLITIMQADSLINSPKVYAAFLLWFLDSLWQRLPEIGDTEKPKLALFFDESHLLFNAMPAALLQKIEQTIRLIRSKGVGVYFVTQESSDLPAIIQSQISHKIHHSRETGVGIAQVETMDSTGKPIKFSNLRVALPVSKLGTLSESELPAIDPEKSESDWQAMGKAELLFLCFVVLAIIAAALALYMADSKVWLGLAAVAIVAMFKR